MLKHAAPRIALLMATLLAGAAGGCAAPGAGPGTDGGGMTVDAPVVEPMLAAFAAPEVLARRLAALIWDGPPDDALIRMLQAAPPLSRPAIGQIAEQMLGDPRARVGVTAFYRHWLLPLPPTDPDPLRTSMMQEGPALGTYLTLDTPGTLFELLQAPYTFVDETLARHYGMTDVTGSAFRKVAYPAGQPRVGVLSGAGLLAHFASVVPSGPSWPAKRGWMVTDPLLCSPVLRSFLTSMGPDVNQSIRQQMLDMTAQGSCPTCHTILNSPGFAFIGFDIKGLWHPETGAAANETQGWIPDKIMPDAPTFDGPASLAQVLANRDETRRCFVRQWMQYGIDREKIVTQEIPEADRGSIEVALRAFAASGYQLRGVIVAVAQSNVLLRP